MSNINNLQKELDDLKISFTKRVDEIREKYFVSPTGLLVLNGYIKSDSTMGFCVDLELLRHLINEKLSFDVVKTQANELQNEFNSKLVSLLNNCDEQIILGVIPPYSASHNGDLVNGPILINVLKKAEHFTLSAHIYSSST